MVRSVNLNTDTILHSRFMIRPNEVNELSHRWIETLWFGPSDLRYKVRIPMHMTRVYIPCWLFFVDITVSARIAASAAAVENKPPFATLSFSDKVYFKCACSDERDRKYYSKEFDASWTLANISIHNTSIVNPQSSSSSPRSVEEAISMFKFISDISSKSAPAKSSASFELIQPDVFIHPYVNVEEVWSEFEKELVELHIKKAVSVLERKGYTSESIEDVRVDPPKYKSALVYMPVYNGTYTYKSGTYKISINGQNGKVCGERPYTPFVSAIKGIFGI